MFYCYCHFIGTLRLVEHVSIPINTRGLHSPLMLSDVSLIIKMGRFR